MDGDSQVSNAEQIKAALAGLSASVAEAAAHTDVHATAAQREAGNYRKGRVAFHGLVLSIENPAGSYREGIKDDGSKWRTKLRHHYGYVNGVIGADGDPVDVFIGPNPSCELVHVINQVDHRTGRFDEHKVMLGFESKAAAKAGYLGCYETGWQGLGSMKAMTLPDFKKWLLDQDHGKHAADKTTDGSRPAPNAVGGRFAHSDFDDDSDPADPQHRFDVHNARGANVGYAVTKPSTDGDYVWVGGLSVKKNYRGHGLGRQLLQRVIDHHKNNELRLRASPYKDKPLDHQQLLDFYRSFGFEQFDNDYRMRRQAGLAVRPQPKDPDSLDGRHPGQRDDPPGQGGVVPAAEAEGGLNQTGPDRQPHTVGAGQAAPAVGSERFRGDVQGHPADTDDQRRSGRDGVRPERADPEVQTARPAEVLQRDAGRTVAGGGAAKEACSIYQEGLDGDEAAGQIPDVPLGPGTKAAGAGLQSADLPGPERQAVESDPPRGVPAGAGGGLHRHRHATNIMGSGGPSRLGDSRRDDGDAGGVADQAQAVVGGQPQDHAAAGPRDEAGPGERGVPSQGDRGQEHGRTPAKDPRTHHAGPRHPEQAAAGNVLRRERPRDYGDLSKLQPGKYDYVVQHHLADRAGPHYDVRMGNKDLGLYSWAVPRGLPQPGSSRLAVRTPVHRHRYMNFEGSIPAGRYGSGSVTKHDSGEITVHRATEAGVHFSKGDNSFALMKWHTGGKRQWVLINTTPRDRSHPLADTAKAMTAEKTAAYKSDEYGKPRECPHCGGDVYGGERVRGMKFRGSGKCEGCQETFALPEWTEFPRKDKDPDKIVTVAVDLDGTLAKEDGAFDPDKIGDPRPNARTWMRMLEAAGCRLIVWTVRGDEDQVKDWLIEHKIPFHFVNENPDQPDGTSGKVIADAYVDNKGFDASGDWNEFGPDLLRRIGIADDDTVDEDPVPMMQISVHRTTIIGG